MRTSIRRLKVTILVRQADAFWQLIKANARPQIKLNDFRGLCGVLFLSCWHEICINRNQDATPTKPVPATSSDTLRGVVNLGVTPPFMAPGVPQAPGALSFSLPYILHWTAYVPYVIDSHLCVRRNHRQPFFYTRAFSIILVWTIGNRFWQSRCGKIGKSNCL